MDRRDADASAGAKRRRRAGVSAGGHLLRLFRIAFCASRWGRSGSAVAATHHPRGAAAELSHLGGHRAAGCDRPTAAVGAGGGGHAARRRQRPVRPGVHRLPAADPAGGGPCRRKRSRWCHAVHPSAGDWTDIGRCPARRDLPGHGLGHHRGPLRDQPHPSAHPASRGGTASGGHVARPRGGRPA